MALAKSKGFEVVERHIRPEELADFSECFIVGTAAEVTPVARRSASTLHARQYRLSLMDDFALLVRRELQPA